MTSAIQFDPATHVYRDQQGIQKPSVTWILAQSGLCDFSFVEEEVRRQSMRRGTNVHWMLQLEDQGGLNYRRVPKKLRPFRKAYLTWRSRSGFVPWWIEYQFISPFGFAGTMDRFGYFPVGDSAVVDFKTGDAAVQNWTRYQLAAYAVATHPKIAVARTRRRIGLALHSDGTYGVKEFPVSSFDCDWAIFMEAMKRVGNTGSERTRN